jgi:hypothetical protein
MDSGGLGVAAGILSTNLARARKILELCVKSRAEGDGQDECILSLPRFDLPNAGAHQLRAQSEDSVAYYREGK